MTLKIHTLRSFTGAVVTDIVLLNNSAAPSPRSRCSQDNKVARALALRLSNDTHFSLLNISQNVSQKVLRSAPIRVGFHKPELTHLKIKANGN